MTVAPTKADAISVMVDHCLTDEWKAMGGAKTPTGDGAIDDRPSDFRLRTHTGPNATGVRLVLAGDGAGHASGDNGDLPGVCRAIRGGRGHGKASVMKGCEGSLGRWSN